MGRAQIAFIVLGMLMVCSLVAGFVGPAVIDAIVNADSSQTIDQPTSGGEGAKLEASLRKDVKDHPNDPQAMSNLATYLSNTGNSAEAIEWYEKALALTPDDTNLRLIFARTLADAHKSADAELQFQKVIAADPHNPQSHYYLAELYRAWDPPRKADAIREYQKVIAVGADTYVADQSREQLIALGAATPAATPNASATPATPRAGGTGS
jgi:cytochrome c-type biogenesis protein CcmH/NrfG